MSNFEFDGEKYKKASKHQKEWGNKLISGIEMNGNESILDLGCGDGILTKQLSELVPEGRVIGIDASVGMIQTAKALEAGNLSFVCMDINEIAYENVFDIIFSNAALHWVKNHRRLLQNCLTALKQNGKLVCNFAGEGTSSVFNETVREIMDMPSYRDSFSGFDWPWYMPKKEEYLLLVESAGFKEFDVSLENVDRYFADSEEMIKWIDQPCLVPFLECVPEEKKESFRNMVIEMMIEKTEQTDGRCFETFRRIIVRAVK